MKPNIIIAAACVALAACSQSGLDTPKLGVNFEKGQKVILTVANGGTKVIGAWDAAKDSVCFTWEEGDKIAVKVNGDTAHFKLIEGAGTRKGTFEGKMPASGTTYDIHYPVEIPDISVQDYSANALPHNKMYATAENCELDKSFALKPQSSALKLNLWGGQTVGKIVVTNTSSTEETKPTYTLNCGTGVNIGTTSDNATPFLIIIPQGEFNFSIEVFDNSSKPIDKVITKQTFIAGKIINLSALKMIDGALPGIFSVSETKRLRFSKGNLQATYHSSSTSYTWGFAKTQYDIVGNAEGNTTIGSSQADGAVVDLFGWVGASSSFEDAEKYGITTSETIDDYGNIKNEVLKADWGTTIDNAGTWSFMTREEWAHLIGSDNPQPGERSKSLCKTGVLVCGVECLVIAPDSFSGTIADSYDSDSWTIAESAGLVCLPCGGHRKGSEVTDLKGCFYWANTAYDENRAQCIFYGVSSGKSYELATYYSLRYWGYNVRLIAHVQ